MFANPLECHSILITNSVISASVQSIEEKKKGGGNTTSQILMCKDSDFSGISGIRYMLNLLLYSGSLLVYHIQNNQIHDHISIKILNLCGCA